MRNEGSHDLFLELDLQSDSPFLSVSPVIGRHFILSETRRRKNGTKGNKGIMQRSIQNVHRIWDDLGILVCFLPSIHFHSSSPSCRFQQKVKVRLTTNSNKVIVSGTLTYNSRLGTNPQGIGSKRNFKTKWSKLKS